MRIVQVGVSVEVTEAEVAWPAGRAQLANYADQILRRAFSDALADRVTLTAVSLTGLPGGFRVHVEATEPAAP